LITIIIEKKSPFIAIAILYTASLQAMCPESDHPVFTSLDFEITFLFYSNVVNLASNPPTWRIKSLYLSPPGTGWFIFIAFGDSLGYAGGILTRLHTGIIPITVHKNVH
jgi:hypothetical protein